jgi:DNA repair protein SbcD/Mre11
VKSFSFIHAADLHIDSPFRGVTATDAAPKALGEALYASTFQAFDALIENTLELESDFLVIAGDVYDGQDRSLRAQLRLRDGLARLDEAGVSSFIVHGNHDPLDGHLSSIEWPPHSHFFGSKLETVAVDNRRGEPVAMVSGISFRSREETRNLAQKFSRQDTSLFEIGLLHSNVDANAEHGNYAPCTLEDLQKASMDYWALGHVHTQRILYEAPWVVYPGNIQGRSIREQGPRGCYHVHVDDTGHVTLDFIALDKVRWAEVVVLIEGVETIDALDRLVCEEVDRTADSNEGRNLVCRLRLQGRGALHGELRREGSRSQILERLRERLAGRDPFVWVQWLELDTHPEVDLESRMGREDLLGEVLTLAREYEGDPQALATVYQAALAELWDNTRVEKAQLQSPATEDILGMLREAELLCVDHLEADG